MKRAGMTSAFIAGLGCLATFSVAYAVCVTPQQLKDKTNTIITAGTEFPSESHFVYTNLKGFSSTIGTLLQKMEPNLDKNVAVDLTNILPGLQKDKDNWQPVDPVPLTTPTPKEDEAKLLQSNLMKVQKWAEYGELVIVTDGTHIGLVFLGTTATDATNAKWPTTPKFKVPPIAYVPTGKGKANTDPLDKLFDDPAKIQFFRYKN